MTIGLGSATTARPAPLRPWPTPRAGAAAAPHRSARGARLRHPDRRRGDPPGAVLVVRHVQAPPSTGPLDGGFDVVATGHNLDDEAAVLLGNVLHWNTEYLGRQAPVLPARRLPGR